MDYYNFIFSDWIEFVCMDGPYEITNLMDNTIKKAFKGPFYGWYEYNKVKDRLEGIDTTLNYVINFMDQHGPFQGVLGFSQGSLIARLILKIHHWKGVFRQPLYQPDFGVIVSGFTNPKANYFTSPEAK